MVGKWTAMGKEGGRQAMAMATKRAMAMATRVVGNENSNGDSSKSVGNGNKGGG